MKERQRHTEKGERDTHTQTDRQTDRQGEGANQISRHFTLFFHPDWVPGKKKMRPRAVGHNTPGKPAGPAPEPNKEGGKPQSDRQQEEGGMKDHQGKALSPQKTVTAWGGEGWRRYGWGLVGNFSRDFCTKQQFEAWVNFPNCPSSSSSSSSFIALI